MTDLNELARSILAGAAGDESVEVCVGRAVETEVRVHGAAVESLTVAESHGIGVRVVVDGREGIAHAGSFDDDVVRTLLHEARDNAGFAEPDDRVGLARPDGVAVVAVDRWDRAVETTSTDDKIALALELEAAVTAADERVRGVRAAIYGDTRSETAVVNTHGIDAHTSATMASISTSVLVDDIDGGTRTGGAVDAARGPTALDVAKVADLAVARGLQLLGAGPPTTGRPLVVLEPRFAATILALVAGMLSGERVVKGRTPFADRIGDAVAAGALTLYDDPTDAASLGAAATDGEGLACRRVPLISGGSLDGYLHDTRSARGLGTSSTGSALRAVRGTPGPGHRSLHAAPGDGGLDEFIAGIADGLLVASLQGLHSGVNAVSGDFSVGVEGVRIRDGALAEPIREATLAGAIPRMLLDIESVGADLETQPGGAIVPSLVLAGLTLGGGA
ncbi:MAG: TldD/PmbA family protein [Acidimicrobiales bacterium]|nr:TldD/PmbA family protein [Acidimicrobiales bacterium]